MLEIKIKNYEAALKAYFELKDEIAKIFRTDLPKAKGQAISAANGAISIKSQIMNCTDIEEINSLNARVKQNNELAEVARQLERNLTARLENLRREESKVNSDLRRAQAEMWHEKANQILADTVFPPEILNNLARVIAARTIADRGLTSHSYSNVLRNHLGKIEEEELETVKNSLWEEMGIERHNFSLY